MGRDIASMFTHTVKLHSHKKAALKQILIFHEWMEQALFEARQMLR